MDTMEFVKKINDEIKNLKLRIEEIKLLDRDLYEQLWCKSKISKAISELADASMIICGMYPDEDTTF